MYKKFISGGLMFVFVAGALLVGAFAQANTTLTADQITCIQGAVEARDGGIITADDTFHSAITSALTTRKDAIKAGWALGTTDQIKPALQSAWTAYSTSAKAARDTLRNSKQSLWDAFRTTRKDTCHVGPDGNGASTDGNI